MTMINHGNSYKKSLYLLQEKSNWKFNTDSSSILIVNIYSVEMRIVYFEFCVK